MKTLHAAMLAALVLAVAVSFAAAGESTTAPKNGYLVYVGTYTGPQSKGIYVFRFDPKTGEAVEPELAAEVGNPSWVSIHPNRRFLYAVSEFNNDKSALTAFKIDPESGKLTLLNAVPAGGNSAVHVSIDATGKNALIANYHGGSIAVRRINEDGSLGEQTAFMQHSGSSVTPRQSQPFAHSIYLSPDNRFVLVPDLGLDKIMVYRFDAAQGALVPNDPPFARATPGTGPRHLAFGHQGKFVYLVGEITRTVTVFSWDARRGVLTELQTISALSLSDAPVGRAGSAEAQVSPDGAFLYVSNRGPDTIGVFSIDADSGKLTPVEQVPTQGVMPRNFSLDPTGAYLFAANQNSNNVVIFHVDRKTGRLSPTGKVLTVGGPVCVSLMPLG
jgi:6-phosphogluconolactonase